ncbi:MAG TPA: class I SAM-dependent methyltransferase [Dongiaceae bacterium]|nr:class I SAM-dependent methyltransferase [Dongiaceae bacterium]
MTISCPITDALAACESGHWKSERSLRPGGIDLTVRAIALCRLSAGARVLDLGCGSGESTEYLSSTFRFKAIGMDLSASACRSSRQRDRALAIVRADAVRLPFASASMDALLAECVLSIIDDKAAVLAECNRVLKPGGRLAITDLYARNPEALGRLRIQPTVCVSGMIARAELEAELAKQNSVMQVWEDHTDCLREWVARCVFEHGSPDWLWKSSHMNADESQQISAALKAARPGYFLLVACKHQEPVHRGQPS